jgi:DNA-binding NarL/FixJ family response regulator
MAENQKILIVDDEPDFALALRMVLEAKFYRVATATNKARAQEEIKDEKPDVIILGTITPRGEAFPLHQWLKQNPRTKDLPILVLDAPLEKRLVSGWSVDEAMQMEAEDYLTKPVEPASLLPRIQRLLDKVTRRIRVLVVDDHAIVRDGICSMLVLQRDMEVVGEAVDGKDAVEKVLQLSPDVVLMDIVMPAMDGIEATKYITKERPQTKVLILTQYDDEENFLATEQVGAYGFIPKRAASSHLIAGIKSVYGGKRFTEPFATGVSD